MRIFGWRGERQVFGERAKGGRLQGIWAVRGRHAKSTACRPSTGATTQPSTPSFPWGKQQQSIPLSPHQCVHSILPLQVVWSLIHCDCLGSSTLIFPIPFSPAGVCQSSAFTSPQASSNLVSFVPLYLQAPNIWL